MNPSAIVPEADAPPMEVSGNGTLIYHQTIIPSQGITHAVEGSFTLPNSHDFVVIRHRTLELWTLHADSSRCECIHSTALFANVYAAVAVPTSSATASGRGDPSSKGVLDSGSAVARDGIHYLALTAETGYVTLLRYELLEPPMPTRIPLPSGKDADVTNGTASATMMVTTSLKGSFIKVSEVCLGRSGVRVAIPGARMVVGHDGAALFISALMRSKVVVPIIRTNAEMDGQGILAAEEEPDDPDADEGNDENGGGGGLVMPKKRRRQRKEPPKGVIALGSPIEVHRQTVIFSICALEGFIDNTVFAALEEDIAEVTKELQSGAGGENGASGVEGVFLKLSSAASGTAENLRRKHLVVYAYVPSLQQVQRTHLVHLPPTAHRLISVPAAPCGPGGVLVCTETELIWYDLSSRVVTDGAGASGSGPVPGAGVFKCSVPFARRVDFTETLYDPSITAHAVTCVAHDFFMLLQDEQGDLFRVVITPAGVQQAYDALRAQPQLTASVRPGTAMGPPPSSRPVAVPNPLTVHYFDTIPPVSTMVLFRKGFLFAAAEAGPVHGLYKITKNGYVKEKDYILKRVKRIRNPAVPNGNESLANPEDQAADPPKPHVDAKDEKMAAPSMLPPSATTRAAGEPNPSLLAVKHERLISVYQPHSRPRHMALVQTYPSTPAILSFTTSIPGVKVPSATDDPVYSQSTSSAALQQPQVQIHAVAGRGADSILLQARYGYATRKESSFPLPAVFHTIIPLPSALEMRRLLRQQHDAIATVNHASRGGHGSRIKALKQLAATTTSGGVWTDKIILCTGHGTTVFNVGRTVEQDTLSGFATAERTLAAATLKYGCGYVQVTPHGIHVLPTAITEEDGMAAQQVGSLVVAEAAHWTHPHGKPVIAAAATPTTLLLSFAQGGGIASFDFGLTGTQLRQCDILPTFPTTPAVSLLQPPPASALSGTVQSDLNSLLFNNFSSASYEDALGLAALAVVSQEVYLVDPRKLREPLEKINCQRSGEINTAITSVLLTFLGGAGGGTSGLRLAHSHSQRRLFCFVGYMDGMLTRCELDPRTAKVMDRAELSCGAQACQLIAGDGESVCYVLCGEHSWRCDVRDGVPKVVPWRFPTRQTFFARFVTPSAKQQSVKQESGNGDGAADSITLISTDRKEELVVGVRDLELSLFSAHQMNDGASTSLEYSFSSHRLPVAGRRVVQHPTRPSYLIIVSTEHRGHSMAEVARHRKGAGTTVAPSPTGANTWGIPLDSPGRSLGRPNHYNSTLQLFNQDANHVFPPYYFPEGDAAMCVTVGSFFAGFGKEPVVIVGTASQFTHGAGCGTGASWTQGWLHTFRCVASSVAGGGVIVGSDGAPVFRLEPLHNTLLRADTDSVTGAAGVADYPSAVHLCEDVGLLFVGMGKSSGLRVYVWGQQQFLRKRHLPNVPGRIVAIETVFVSPPSGVATSASSAGATGGASSPQAASPFYLPDLYQCPYGNTTAQRNAHDKQLLIVCATVDQSIFVASLLSGGRTAPSFLLLIARDTVPRHLTSLCMLDERTAAVSDRFGNVVFLRIPQNTRFGFSEPVEQLKDAELSAAQKFCENEQILEEVACHHVGQVVTSLRVQPYDPSNGTDASLAICIVYYATTLGAVGAYIPFVSEDDAVLAAHTQPLLASHMRLLLGPQSGHLAYNIQGHLTASPTSVPVHNVIEGDLFQLYRQASTAVFTTEAKVAIEDELERLTRMEAARRRVLGLPPRELPLIVDLVAKQRALVTLPL